MDWKNHLFFGFVFGILVLLLLNLLQGITFVDKFSSILVLLVFSTASALVPDLDHDVSKGRQVLDYGFLLFAAFFSYSTSCNNSICLPNIPAFETMTFSFLALAGVYYLVFRFLKPKHRGITHTIAAACAFGGLTFIVFGPQMAIFGCAGYLSHLVSDFHFRII